MYEQCFCWLMPYSHLTIRVANLDVKFLIQIQNSTSKVFFYKNVLIFPSSIPHSSNSFLLLSSVKNFLAGISPIPRFFFDLTFFKSEKKINIFPLIHPFIIHHNVIVLQTFSYFPKVFIIYESILKAKKNSLFFS